MRITLDQKIKTELEHGIFTTPQRNPSMNVMLVNYRRRLVIVGDVSAHEAKSEAFAALVRERNRGRNVAFLKSLDDFRS